MTTNRRAFIRQTTAVTAGLGMMGTGTSTAWASMPSASEKLNIGLIGCRNMGFGVLRHHLNTNEVNCVALCDVDNQILNSRAAEIQEKFNQKPKLFRDFRKLLEQKEIDAVIIGTPDHWHCLITVYALQAGKHVYVEKPMANSIAELDIMVKAARYYGKVVQVGQQQRSGFIFQKANEMIKQGQIGTLRKVNIWANFNYGIGPEIVPDEPVPDGVDYDLWLGPAPLRPYNKNRFHGSWRHWWDYGGGLQSDWGVHLVDMGLWAGDILEGPEKTLVYAANTYPAKRARDSFDSMSVCYPKKDFVINWDMTGGLEKGPWDMSYGIAFVGDDATIVTDRSKLIVYPEMDQKLKKPRVEAYSFTGGKESQSDHARNFLNCIKSGEKLACPPEKGRAAALHVHIANIAARTGESLLIWDEEKKCFSNSAAANSLITPEYRNPWKLPVVG